MDRKLLISEFRDYILSDRGGFFGSVFGKSFENIGDSIDGFSGSGMKKVSSCLFVRSEVLDIEIVLDRIGACLIEGHIIKRRVEEPIAIGIVLFPGLVFPGQSKEERRKLLLSVPDDGTGVKGISFIAVFRDGHLGKIVRLEIFIGLLRFRGVIL